MGDAAEYQVTMAGHTEGEIPSQLNEIEQRLEEDEQRIDRLQNTLDAVAKESSDISISSPCSECEECLMLLKNGMLYCPRCGAGRSA